MLLAHQLRTAPLLSCPVLVRLLCVTRCCTLCPWFLKLLLARSFSDAVAAARPASQRNLPYYGHLKGEHGFALPHAAVRCVPACSLHLLARCCHFLSHCCSS